MSINPLDSRRKCTLDSMMMANEGRTTLPSKRIGLISSHSALLYIATVMSFRQLSLLFLGRFTECRRRSLCSDAAHYGFSRQKSGMLVGEKLTLSTVPALSMRAAPFQMQSVYPSLLGTFADILVGTVYNTQYVVLGTRNVEVRKNTND